MLPLPVSFESVSEYQRTTFVAARTGDGLPQGVKLIRAIGKGSNNRVHLAKKGNALLAVRIPRAKSDTRRLTNAALEFENSMVAARIGAAPQIYDAWYTRRATAEQPCGLHMITECFSLDLHALATQDVKKFARLHDELQERTVAHLRNMAKTGLLCYDLKAANAVVNTTPFDLRFVDFGSDYSEYRPFDIHNEHVERAPVLSYIQRLVQPLESTSFDHKWAYSELIYSVMLILLSSSIELTLHQCPSAMRESAAKRRFLNFLCGECRRQRQCIRPELIPLIKQILRHRDIKDTIQHYMGRRNGGTKRTFALSGFGPFVDPLPKCGRETPVNVYVMQ